MAHTAPGGSRPRVVATLSFALVAVLAAACAAAPPSPSPSPRPTPVVTPNPHLPDPASAQDVFNGLGREGLKITTNTAVAGADGTAVITRISATYLGWPLDVTQFRTSADLVKAAKWKSGEAPGRGEAPVTLAGGNILILWGPRTAGAKPRAPDDRQRAALDALVTALDRLLSPIRTRTVVPVNVAATAASPASAAPSVPPRATPTP